MVETWSWHGPKRKHFISMSLAKIGHSLENITALASLEGDLGKTWSQSGFYSCAK